MKKFEENWCLFPRVHFLLTSNDQENKILVNYCVIHIIIFYKVGLDKPNLSLFTHVVLT